MLCVCMYCSPCITCISCDNVATYIIAVMWTTILCVYDVSVLQSCDSHMQVGDYVYMYAMVM